MLYRIKTGATIGGRMSDYECWRITGSLVNSMDSCPVGSAEKCMGLSVKDECLNGKEIKL